MDPSEKTPMTGTSICFREFDVPRLSQAIGIHLLQWHEVNDPESQVLGDLGCWTVWETHPSSMIKSMDITDISWTRAPAWVERTFLSVHHSHASFWSLASLGFPETRSKSLEFSLTNRPSPQHQVSLPLDDHVLCFDFFYYVGAHHTWEWESDYSPAWRFIVDAHSRRAMSEPTPPYISVHIRHGDFSHQCKEVSEAQEELRTRKGIDATHLIMTSDERDPEWWSDVGALGHPVFIDAIIQSNGAGFVGTRDSTMSTLANRRVQSWNDGATQLVRWGRPGADDH
ncbi:uncharacterized protein F5891DRAFT_1130253 [Suillus fuscotomentosus]|uniref:Uncharacterized protein n=1 Tax=Suillus fuscotomentosus TaxID=1912939 RepID=A0AAD4E1K4_9AGAM|nr:uncharacterized protein F5891DRAFT_1130253 [Suillus fuscotomentosus]KAG1896598.1 hypothetical protein F5891DRAFT_1130253 [Suillus fuscotomentosus]